MIRRARLTCCAIASLCICWNSLLGNTSIVRAGDPPHSDQQLALKVDRKLQTDARLRELQIEARVASGVLTLKGEAPSFYDRMRVEQLCERIEGVSRVDNRIAVVPVLVADSALTRAVSERLNTDAYLRLSNLGVSVQDGVVTLQGDALSWNDRRRASMVAKQVQGVAEIRNQLQVNPAFARSTTPAATGDDEQINNEIRSLLSGEGVLAELAIEYRTVEGEVTLIGSVDSFRKKLFLRELVAAIPGVLELNTRQLVVDRSLQAEKDESVIPSIAAAVSLVQLAVDTALQNPSESVTVDATIDGQILLSGTVDSLARKDRFERLAKEFSGRRPIRNAIEVIPPERDSQAISAEIQRIFSSDAALNGAPIEIEVNDSVVTLSGKVVDFNTKSRAVRIASHIAGVSAIENKLLVAWTPRFSDDGLKKSIEKRLRQNGLSEAEGIQVDVTRGEAVLRGKLNDADIVQKALEIATSTDGIRLVTNQIDY